jgi:hypothetical protein
LLKSQTKESACHLHYHNHHHHHHARTPQPSPPPPPPSQRYFKVVDELRFADPFALGGPTAIDIGAVAGGKQRGFDHAATVSKRGALAELTVFVSRVREPRFTVGFVCFINLIPAFTVDVTCVDTLFTR